MLGLFRNKTGASAFNLLGENDRKELEGKEDQHR